MKIIFILLSFLVCNVGFSVESSKFHSSDILLRKLQYSTRSYVDSYDEHTDFYYTINKKGELCSSSHSWKNACKLLGYKDETVNHYMSRKIFCAVTMGTEDIACAQMDQRTVGVLEVGFMKTNNIFNVMP